VTELDTVPLPVLGATVTVLVVDDTPSLRALTRLALQGTGFEVVGEAGDGLEAVEQAERLRPDLVLLDLAMPVMDGLEALPLLRRALPAAKVVIVSGFDRKAMESQVLDAGADAYLQKGLAPEVSLEALRRLFPGAPAATVPPPRPAADALRTVAQQEQDDRLGQLEEELEELLYVLSHDLSEPVHIISGFAQRLARRARTDEDGEFCEYILEASERMQQLLDGLLEYARAGRGELPQELLDCPRVVDRVVAGLGRALADSGGRVTVGDLPHQLVTNRLVLTQVLHNLVGNAVKFVRPGVPPQVLVDAATAAGIVTFRVSDNGIGIEPEQHERIFQPFKRLHSRERYPGSGIGLAICRRLVHRQGGRIWLESGEDGSTFFVELPQ
jgi:two-component system sensor histidine kinase/response regulator